MENKKIQNEMIELNPNKFTITIKVLGLNSPVKHQIGFRPLFCALVNDRNAEEQ